MLGREVDGFHVPTKIFFDCSPLVCFEMTDLISKSLVCGHKSCHELSFESFYRMSSSLEDSACTCWQAAKYPSASSSGFFSMLFLIAYTRSLSATSRLSSSLSAEADQRSSWGGLVYYSAVASRFANAITKTTVVVHSCSSWGKFHNFFIVLDFDCATVLRVSLRIRHKMLQRAMERDFPLNGIGRKYFNVDGRNSTVVKRRKYDWIWLLSLSFVWLVLRCFITGRFISIVTWKSCTNPLC